MDKIKETSLCYIEDNNRYLMLHRVKKINDMNHDKWLGVGGKLEEGEGPEECMLREVYEETGLRLSSWRYRGIIFFNNDIYESEIMHLFTADSYTGEISDCDEGVLEWVGKEQVTSLPIWEGDKLFFRLLNSSEPFFRLELNYSGEILMSAFLNGEEIDTAS